MSGEKIRFGMIGTNKISEWFLQGAQYIEAISITAIYSRSEEKAKEFAQKHNIPYTFTDLECLAESECMDAVYIASPNALHAEQAILFINHKKHVLCEKAFASNAKEVKAMIEAASKQSVILMEAMRTTHMPNFHITKKNMYKIGKIRRYIGSYCQYSSRYDAYKDGILLNAFNPQLSNGSLMDIGVYCIHPLIELFGSPQSIRANAVMLDHVIDGEGSAVFGYEDMEGVVIYSKISNSTLPSEIQGEEGNIVIQGLRDFDHVKIVYRDGTEEELSQGHIEEGMYYEINDFIQLIQSKDYQKNQEQLQISLEVMLCMDEIRNQIGLIYPADLT